MVLVWGIFVARELKIARRGGRRRVRRPIRSEKRDAKRAARRYASELTVRRVTWKRARKLLNRLDREGRALLANGNGE